MLISIPTPCHEDWNKMTPNEKGAYCKVCSKTVVDFTKLSDDEVKDYFFTNRDKNTCGHFRTDQLADEDKLLTWLLNEPVAFWKKFMAIVVIVFGTLLTGCDNSRTIGKIDTHKNELLTQGAAEFTCMKMDTATHIIPSDTVEITCTTVDGGAMIVGEIETPPPVIKGDVWIGVPDTVAVIDTLVQQIKTDSIKGISIKKNDCADSKTDSLYY
jgi:hypothetical protein